MILALINDRTITSNISVSNHCISSSSLYEAPCDPLDLGPVVLEREVVGRLAEGVLGVQEAVPQVVVPPTLAEVQEAGDQV